MAVQPQNDVQATNASNSGIKVHSMLDSKFPVLVPYAQQLQISDREFASFISTLKPQKKYESSDILSDIVSVKGASIEADKPGSKFLNKLKQTGALNMDAEVLAANDQTLTANGDLAFKSTGNALVDLFYGLKKDAVSN